MSKRQEERINELVRICNKLSDRLAALEPKPKPKPRYAPESLTTMEAIILENYQELITSNKTALAVFREANEKGLDSNYVAKAVAVALANSQR